MQIDLQVCVVISCDYDALSTSAAFVQMLRPQRALEDADKCIELSPKDYNKGYLRKFNALNAFDPRDDAQSNALLATIGSCLDSGIDSTAIRKTLRALDVEEYKRRFPSTTQTTTTKSSETKQTSDTSPQLIHSSFKQNPELVSGQMPDVVLEFAQSTVNQVLSQLEEEQTEKTVDGVKLRSTCFLLTSKDVPLPVIGIDKAFEEPALRASCTDYLRECATRDECFGAVVVAQRSTIAFPQVWQNQPKTSFPFADDVDGLFVMIENATNPDFPWRRIVHFMPLVHDTNGRARVVREQIVALDPDQFSLLPKLLK